MSKYSEPGPLKAKLLAWSEFNMSEIDTLLFIFQSPNANEIYPYLEKILDLNASYLKSKILIDLHYYAIRFAIENEFTKIQLSSFLSILRALHKATQETPFENYEYVIKYFNELMICHSIKRPPFCIDIFDGPVAAKIINFITNSYLKNYKLYKYTFTPMLALNFEIDYPNRTPSPIQIEIEKDKDDEPLKLINNGKEERIKTPSTVNTSLNTNKLVSVENSYTSEDPNHTELKSYIKKIMMEHLESEDIKKELEDLEIAKIDSINQRAQSSYNKKK